jgi:hypothetical protein
MREWMTVGLCCISVAIMNEQRSINRSNSNQLYVSVDYSEQRVGVNANVMLVSDIDKWKSVIFISRGFLEKVNTSIR